MHVKLSIQETLKINSSISLGLVKNTVKGLMVIVLAFSLSACGGGKKNKSVAEQGPDITRPPETIGTQRQAAPAQQRDPDEAISFDEWRKQRLKELEEEQNP